MSLRNHLMRAWFSRRLRAIDWFRRYPLDAQREQFGYLMERVAGTSFGHDCGLTVGTSPKEFARRVEVQTYDSFKGYIERMLAGERDVTWRGEVDLFAKSSGTTSDRSKYIPVTRESVWHNHTLGMQDIAALYGEANPKSKIYDGKTLTLGGAHTREGHALVGDLSAILIEQTGMYSGWFRAPRMKTALIPDFDEKLDAICCECTKENITAFAGVPSWNLLLMRRVLEYTGAKHIRDVWPDMELFVHGGVSFGPYRKSYTQLVPGLKYLETYNASEGFFALQDDTHRDDMLLMLDYGTYYEFRDTRGHIVPLEGVKRGEIYALLISSINGLWRYEIGDTVEFTSTDPYRIRFAGRTKQFINVFGEEVIVDNAERALEAACDATGAVVEEYSVGPMYMEVDKRGAHEWVVEFSREPDTLARFVEVLDTTLRAINSDYDAKRRSTLDLPKVNILPRGTAVAWLRARGKNKLPRMQNDRKVIEELLSCRK